MAGAPDQGTRFLVIEVTFQITFLTMAYSVLILKSILYQL
jgi:hypothetical protein